MNVHRHNLWLLPARTIYPALDEEYFEWLDVLRTVDSAKSMDSSDLLVVIEVGAAHGPWAARAWRANDLLHRRPMHIVLVEPHPASVARAYQHMAINMVDAGNFSIWQAALGPNAGTTNFSTSACSLTTGHAFPVTSSEPKEGAAGSKTKTEDGRDGVYNERQHASDPAVLNVEMVTLDTVLAPFAKIHLLDLDIQVHLLAAPSSSLGASIKRLPHVAACATLGGTATSHKRSALSGGGDARGARGAAAARRKGPSAAHRNASYHNPPSDSPSAAGGQLVGPSKSGMRLRGDPACMHATALLRPGFLPRDMKLPT